MVTQEQLKNNILSLKNALYVWGANGEIITKELVEKLLATCGSDTYDRAYYEAALSEGLGLIAADCSGALCKSSGYDDTAHGYYNRCIVKGTIGSIPRDKVVLVFKMNASGRAYHVGVYTADGKVSEMSSTQLDYQCKALDGNGWTHWGMPDFVSDPDKVMVEAKKDVQIVAGEEIIVDGIPSFENETTSEVKKHRTGAFYLWSADVANGRVKITTRPEYVGKPGMVTCWINVSDITETVAITPTDSVAEDSGTIKAGMVFALKNVAVYHQEAGGTSIGNRTGAYVAWEDEPNGCSRIRMTNKESSVGKKGEVSFFVDISALK